LVYVATLSGIDSRASTFRWPRLGACLLASLVLHFAVVPPLLHTRPVDRALPPLLVRVAATRTDTTPVAPHVAAQEEAREHQPMISSKSAVARRVPVAPRAPAVAPRPATVAREPLVTALDAYEQLVEEREREALSEAQRAVPRGAALQRAPQPLAPIRPLYPTREIARGVKGHVLLEVFVGAGGAVDEIVVLEDFGRPEFAQAALRALRRASFSPGHDGRSTVASRVTFHVRFTYE
jgi:TonB family protein